LKGRRATLVNFGETSLVFQEQNDGFIDEGLRRPEGLLGYREKAIPISRWYRHSPSEEDFR
jgi:hypothetical protein